MQVQSIDQSMFFGKNSYLSKSEKALTKDDKLKFLSYHYEAKARNHYQKYLRIKSQFEDVGRLDSFKNLCDVIWLSLKAVYEKLASVNSVAESYKLYPKRFE